MAVLKLAELIDKNLELKLEFLDMSPFQEIVGNPILQYLSYDKERADSLTERKLLRAKAHSV